MRRIAAALLLLTALLGVGVGTAGSALAHTELVSAEPADGASLASAPEQVVLTFNEDLLSETVAIAITDASGAAVGADAAQPAGPTVRIPWPADLAPGSYTVAYRVVADDGHPVTGTLAFSYAGPAASPAAMASSAAASAAPSISSSIAPSVVPSVVPSIASPMPAATNPSPIAAVPADEPAGESAAPIWPIIGFVLAVVALVIVIVLARRGRR